jgi:tetratricopeptide (TPR) repeat protein
VLLGCVHTPKADLSDEPAPEETEAKVTIAPEVKIQTKPIPEDTLYSLVAAELALHRREFELGLQNYRNEAISTRDIEVVKRATQIARILRRHQEATELSELWLELRPDDNEVKLILLSEYIYSSQFERALTIAEDMLTPTEGPGIEDIAIELVRKKSPLQTQLSHRYATLLESYPNNIDLLIGQSILLLAENKSAEALTLAQTANTLAPDNPRVLYQLYRAQFYEGMDEEMLATYKKMVDLQPDNFRLRSNYAKMLIKHDLSSAMEQYEKLHQQEPQNEDVLLSLALLKMDDKQLDAAEDMLLQLIQLGKHEDTAYVSLGEIAQEKNDASSALQYFMKVQGGKHYVDAVSKAANIILNRDGLDQAMLFAAGRRESASGANKESLYLIETDMLIRTGSELAAENLYALALEEFPSSSPILYSRAMYFAEKRDTPAAERDFKSILEQFPENATVLNALGYTLLDQTDRVDDAGVFIEKAYALKPNDAAVVDSMGWLLFKRGKTSDSIALLERALTLYNDDEIAAHLGEALWKSGKKNQAKKIWRDGLKLDSNSTFILEALKRLRVEL